MQLETFNKIERIITLKALFFDIDLNFLSVDDLKRINEIAEDLGIQLPDLDLENIYNSETEAIEKAYEIFKENILTKYNMTKELICAFYEFSN